MKSKNLAIGLVTGLLAGLFVAALPAAAGSARFTAYGPPNGRILTAAALPGQAGGLLLSTDLGGLFRSADGGRTWAWSGLGLAGDSLHAIAADPFHPRALYGASLTAFYRSENLGQSWTAITTGQKFGLGSGVDTEVQLAIAPGQRGQNPVFYLGAGQQLFVSHDLGATWPASRTEELHVAFTALAIDPQHPKTTAFAAAIGLESPGGLLRSTDTGYLWSRLPLPAAFAKGVLGFAIVPTSPPVYLAATLDARIFRSTTGGASWREVRPVAGRTFWRLLADPAAPGTVYGFGSGALFVSTDAGATWKQRGDSLTDGIRTLTLERKNGPLTAWTPFDVYVGAPRFARWSLTLRSAFQIPGEDNDAGRVRFDPADPSTVYVVLGNRAYRSADGGTSWASFAIDDPDLPVGLLDLALDPDDPNHLLLSTAFHGLFESPDRGLTWTPIGPPEQALQEILPIDSHTLLGSTGGGLLRSTEGGATWTSVLGIPVLKLLADPGNRNVVYAVELETDPQTFSKHPFLVKSEDGGATWRTILDRGLSLALDPAHPTTLYSIRDGDLVKTTDGGGTWARIGTYPDNYAKFFAETDLLVDPRESSILYGTSDLQGVLRSTDGGVLWTPAVLTPAIGTGFSFFPDLDQRLYADPFLPHRIYAAVGKRLYVANF